MYIHIYMYVYIYVCTLWYEGRSYVCFYVAFVCVCVCVRVCVCVCACVSVHINARAHTHTHTHKHTRTHTQTHRHTHDDTHTHTHRHTLLHTHTRTHTHMNICTHAHTPHTHTHIGVTASRFLSLHAQHSGYFQLHLLFDYALLQGIYIICTTRYMQHFYYKVYASFFTQGLCVIFTTGCIVVKMVHLSSAVSK